jgi:hypothetical protein
LVVEDATELPNTSAFPNGNSGTRRRNEEEERGGGTRRRNEEEERGGGTRRRNEEEERGGGTRRRNPPYPPDPPYPAGRRSFSTN